MEWLVHRRRNLPMIHSKVDIWVLVLGFPDNDDAGYPWSTVFSLKMRRQANAPFPQGRLLDLSQIATSIGAADTSTNSLANIKRHVDFDVPERPDSNYRAWNLLSQGDVPHPDEFGRLLDDNNESTAAWRAMMERCAQSTLWEKRVMWSVHRAGTISVSAFARESTAWAQTFGRFLLYDNPKGADSLPFLRELRNQAWNEADEERKTQQGRENELAVASSPRQKLRVESIDCTPVKTRLKIWMELCPNRRYFGNFPFEAPVPPAARLNKHVTGELKEMKKGGKNTENQLSNYIHPHVKIDVAQRRRADGEVANMLVLGLVKDAYNLRFSRLGLLQAYDMIVCWAAKVDKDGVSIPLRHALDGCNKVTEDIVAGSDRIEEMSGLEKQLERLSGPSELDRAVELFSEWLERHKDKIVSSPEDQDERLRKWCRRKHVELEGWDKKALKQACRQALETKSKEWKKGKREINAVNFDVELNGSKPTKRARTH
ncbi:hypothetical protein EsH8_IV_001035 [Colletotrichum jinshuiense]